MFRRRLEQLVILLRMITVPGAQRFRRRKLDPFLPVKHDLQIGIPPVRFLGAVYRRLVVVAHQRGEQLFAVDGKAPVGLGAIKRRDPAKRRGETFPQDRVTRGIYQGIVIISGGTMQLSVES